VRADPGRYKSGFAAPVYRAVWERITTWGAPRLFSALWIAVNLYGALLLITANRARWLVAIVIIWPAGQALLALLTRWDAQFDEVVMAGPKYRRFYDVR
jgi:type IV secretory pathway TrbD component